MEEKIDLKTLTNIKYIKGSAYPDTSNPANYGVLEFHYEREGKLETKNFKIKKDASGSKKFIELNDRKYYLIFDKEELKENENQLDHNFNGRDFKELVSRVCKVNCVTAFLVPDYCRHISTFRYISI